MRRLVSLALVVLAACPRNEPMDSTTGDSTGGCTPGSADCICMEDSSCESGLLCSSNICVDLQDSSGGPTSSSTSADETSSSSSTSATDDESSSTAPASVCGDGVLEAPEQCDDGQATKLCDDDCTPAACGDARTNEAAGEACDDGDVDNTNGCIEDCSAASCGDGFLWADVEECDDGNNEPGDGCDETCARERWSHVGVAHDVPVADLHLWEPCWTDTYEAGAPASAPLEACTGDHLLVACRPIGSLTLTLAAHGPREAVTAEVNYNEGERSTANGVDFYWSPYWEGVIGFGPPDTAYCYGNGPAPSDNLCWKVGGNMPQEFVAGRQCGEVGALGNMSVLQTQTWERVLFQSWEA